ncbi:MAG TPA: hypothetical protein VK726_13605 [Acetobacteraceae bacterium]|jgi:hypothetical protein|nr:hypothetical protein [Acetobacteraceae bacterium]
MSVAAPGYKVEPPDQMQLFAFFARNLPAAIGHFRLFRFAPISVAKSPSGDIMKDYRAF